MDKFNKNNKNLNKDIEKNKREIDKLIWKSIDKTLKNYNFKKV